MAQKDYESLTEGWNAYEQGIRDSAAEDDEIVDENFLGLQKVMFYQGAAITLRILNKAGLINEDTMPAVANLVNDIREVHVQFPE